MDTEVGCPRSPSWNDWLTSVGSAVTGKILCSAPSELAWTTESPCLKSPFQTSTYILMEQGRGIKDTQHFLPDMVRWEKSWWQIFTPEHLVRLSKFFVVSAFQMNSSVYWILHPSSLSTGADSWMTPFTLNITSASAPGELTLWQP